MTLALSAGVLVAGAVYLLMQRGLLRIVLGFILLSHGVNLIFMAAGGTSRRGEPLGDELDPAVAADPLPQAFVLTAIVIAFSITIYMLVLAVTGSKDDDTGDSPAVHPGGDGDREEAEAAIEGTDPGASGASVQAEYRRSKDGRDES